MKNRKRRKTEIELNRILTSNKKNVNFSLNLIRKVNRLFNRRRNKSKKTFKICNVRLIDKR